MFDHAEEHVDDDMVVLQANIDDMNPEYCSHVSDLLFERGANDVYWIPIVMKKGRPGLMLNVLAAKTKLDEMKRIIFQETTTLGIRYWDASCHRLGRKKVPVETPWGQIHIKVGILNGEVVQAAPEFSECEAAAKTYQVPLKTVYQTVLNEYYGFKK